MYRYAAASVVFAMLAGCQGENPLYFNDPEEVVEETTEETVEEETPIDLSDLENNLTTAVYDPDTETLYVDMYALDRVGEDYPLEQYIRTESLDVPGYAAYTYQDDALDRFFVALCGQSPYGTAQGAVVADGGQFGEYFGGTQMFAIEAYTGGPEVGLVSYAGTYAGITNLGYRGDEIMEIPTPPGDVSSLTTMQPAVVQGEVFLNADFGDNAVNGAIYNRQIVNVTGQPATDLEDIYLQVGIIDENGAFYGTTSFGDTDQDNGVYGGVFAGTNATGVAGAVLLNDFDEDRDQEQEYGIFVLTQCGLPDDAAICDIVNP